MGPVIDLRLAGLALDRGRVDEAIQRLSAVLESDESISATRAMAVDELGRALIARGDVEAALDGAERRGCRVTASLDYRTDRRRCGTGPGAVAAGDLAGAEAILADTDAVAARASEVDHRRGLTLLLGKSRRARGDLAGARMPSRLCSAVLRPWRR